VGSHPKGKTQNLRLAALSMDDERFLVLKRGLRLRVEWRNDIYFFLFTPSGSILFAI
jgi:hypothetical protein